MKRREVQGPPSTDLLVCFPTRSHLALLPKPICSPSRSSNSYNHRHPHHHHHRGKSIGGGGGDGDGGSWWKTKMDQSELSEPTSPKVTCAGQIKVRPKAGPCKNWQSVMEEIERLRDNKKHGKKPTWIEALGFKKEAMQALTCLRSFKFDLGCFGAFPNANVTSDDDDEEYEDQIDHEKKLMGLGGFHDHDHDRQDLGDHNQNQDVDDDHKEGSSRSAFSKWFMVLEENQDCGLLEKEQYEKPVDDDQEDAQDPSVPPSNALLLMRCRSAPTKSSLEEKEEEEDDGEDDDEDDNDDDDEHDDGKRRENLMDLMKYEGDFYKLSCDIAKETWVVGGINKGSFSRTQSSKRCSIRCLQEVEACLR